MWLCRIAEIPSIRHLYNIACQRGLTRGSDDLNDRDFELFMKGDRDIVTQRRRYNPEDEQRLLRKREDPRTTTFTSEDDKWIIRNYERMDVVAIAIARNHSETAILYRARKLTVQDKGPDGELLEPRPLRRAAVGYPLARVAAWLGSPDEPMSDEELDGLRAAGMDVRVMRDRNGQVEHEWVMARSLAPILEKVGAKLITERGADAFFIKEVLETEAEIVALQQQIDAGKRKLTEFAGPGQHGRLVQIERILQDRVDDAELQATLQGKTNEQVVAHLHQTMSNDELAGYMPNDGPAPGQEGCFFLDHGHKCRNPWAGPLANNYCDGVDTKCEASRVRF